MPLTQLSNTPAPRGAQRGRGDRREAVQTHQVHRMKPGVRGLREGAELLPVGVHGGDIKPREGQRPSESPRPGPGPGVGSSGGWQGWLPRGAGQWRRSRAAPTPASLSFRLLSPWTPPLLVPSPLLGALTQKSPSPVPPPACFLSITTQHF